MNRQFMLTPAAVAIAMVLVTPQVLAQEDENIVVIGLQEDSAVGPDFSYLGAKSRTATKMDLACLLYTSPSPRDRQKSRMPSSA